VRDETVEVEVSVETKTAPVMTKITPIVADISMTREVGNRIMGVKNSQCLLRLIEDYIK
jgi:hypothetical protein